MRTALSMSQSLKMMRGDFPPSSSETFFRLLRAQLKQEVRIKCVQSIQPGTTNTMKGSSLVAIQGLSAKVNEYDDGLTCGAATLTSS